MKLFLFYTVSLSYHGTEEGTVVIVAAPNSPTQEGGGFRGRSGLDRKISEGQRHKVLGYPTTSRRVDYGAVGGGSYC